MSQGLQLGPMVVPVSLLVMLAAGMAALFVGNRVGRRSDIDIEARVWQTIAAGLVVARLVFVWQYRSAYLVEPLDFLDVRDGGWSAWGAFGGHGHTCAGPAMVAPRPGKAALRRFADGDRYLAGRHAGAHDAFGSRGEAPGPHARLARWRAGKPCRFRRQADGDQPLSNVVSSLRERDADASTRPT